MAQSKKKKAVPMKKKSKSKQPAKKAVVKVKAKAKAKAKPKVKAKSPAKVQPKAKSPIKAAQWENFITPLDDRIVVRVAEAPKTIGRIIIPMSDEKPNQGLVLAVGRGHQNKKGKLRPMDVQAGDKILFAPHSGSTMELQGTEVLILREADVLGILNS